ncbi:MAG: twin-arginine translocation signal domain-containing protein [Acidobacteriaceae bacterium]|nr:twin-arginine translocation signal domain-containing protein [Acidobacteriaceae bacterium]
MDRRRFLKTAGAGGALMQAGSASSQTAARARMVHPGVWKFAFGTPEKITPVSTRQYRPAEEGFTSLPAVDQPPVTVNGAGSKRGYLLRFPLAPNEIVYGLGLQLQSVFSAG